MLHVSREVDDSHAAPAQLPLEHVPFPQRISESLHHGLESPHCSGELAAPALAADPPRMEAASFRLPSFR
jgi:hypothetical protein